MVFQAKMVADAADNEIHGVLERFGACIECRHRWQNYCTGFGTKRQVPKLNCAQRRLAWHQDQWPSLFQVHVRGSVNQILRQTVSDGGRCPHAARTDDHTARQIRPAGDARPKVEIVVIMQLISAREVRRASQQVREVEVIKPNAAIYFTLHHFDGGGANGEMYWTTGLEQYLQQPKSVWSATRPGERQDQIFGGHKRRLLDRTPRPASSF
jgi:hypothetical protein